MIVTNNPALADRARLLRQYGWQERYISDIPGGNSRLAEIQAAVLRVKLHSLKKENIQRQTLAQTYNILLRDFGFNLPTIRPGTTHVFHQYVVRLSQRDSMRDNLKNVGIGTLVHYPVPVHLQPAYKGRLPLVTPLPYTEEAARQVLSLPMYPQLNDEQVQYVCDCLIHFLSKNVSEI